MNCPLCGDIIRAGKHPKDSSTVEALPQLVGHINRYHQREIAERTEREAKRDVRSVLPDVHSTPQNEDGQVT